MDKYLVLGNPIGHSLSPSIHKMFAQQTNVQMIYDKQLVPLDEFNNCVDEFVKKGVKGFNVTLPFKGEAFAKTASVDGNAAASMAVNTIKVDEESKLRGFNTDGIGLVRDLIDRLGLILPNSRILVLGAGGAARGIIGSLLGNLPSRIVIANRTVEKAEKLVSLFRDSNQRVPLGWTNLKSLNDDFDLIINTTSVGLEGKFDLIDEQVVRNKICYDLSYGVNAVFVSWARNCGASKATDGLGMLVEQAAESFFIWHGIRPKTQHVFDLLRSSH